MIYLNNENDEIILTCQQVAIDIKEMMTARHLGRVSSQLSYIRHETPKNRKKRVVPNKEKNWEKKKTQQRKNAK